MKSFWELGFDITDVDSDDFSVSGAGCCVVCCGVLFGCQAAVINDGNDVSKGSTDDGCVTRS